MIVSIEIPDPQFKVGDILFEKESEKDLGRTYHVIGISTKGAFADNDIVSIERYYTLVLQSGFAVDQNIKLRPGLNLVFKEEDFIPSPIYKYPIVETLGNYQGTVIGPDTIENVDSRIRAWNAKYPEFSSSIDLATATIQATQGKAKD